MTIEERFFAFVFERQRMWHRRFVLKQPAPWTDDPILSTYKFCNMYRELDACTVYLLDKIRETTDRRTQLLNIIFFRFFNLRDLYEALGVHLLQRVNTLELLPRFDVMKKRGPIFNNAYIISPGQSREPKHVTILRNLEDLDVEALMSRLDQAETPEVAHASLCRIPLVGSFLAGEIWTDLTYIKFFPQGWTDDDFVAIGPGAKWGLEILSGRRLSRREEQENLRYVHTAQQEFLSGAWFQVAYREAFSGVPFLSLTNVEGALCEFRKYVNLSQGKGRRRYYREQQKSPRDAE